MSPLDQCWTQSKHVTTSCLHAESVSLCTETPQVYTAPPPPAPFNCRAKGVCVCELARACVHVCVRCYGLYLCKYTFECQLYISAGLFQKATNRRRALDEPNKNKKVTEDTSLLAC